jgi:pyruvate dehydrogenase E2 component (dihydrolipoamide acetyltransferase)
MAEVVTMIALSPTMDEGTLAEWTIQEGDTVSEGDIIAEVETDKATMEMESWYDGTILKILAEPNDAIAVGDPIAIVGEDGENIDELLADLESGGVPDDQTTEPPGDQTDADAEPEDSDEASTVSAGEQPDSPSAADSTADTGGESGGRLRASPLARRIAADHDLDLQQVDGSGPSGRIIQQDVEAFIESGGARRTTPQQQAPSAPVGETDIIQAPDLPGETEQLSQMRKTIAKRLEASWRSTPHFALTIDIDMGDLMDFRSALNDELSTSEIDLKISVNDLIVKACARALAEYPDMNVAYQGETLRRFDAVNIGVAVAVDGGLVTPTIRNAGEKGLRAISTDIRELAEKARNKDLKPEDYGDSTFSVSNLGMYGIEHFMAVINPPEAGILACGAVEERPVAEDGELTVGTRMKVTLSCDHRAVDGAIGAEFLGRVKNLLESPRLLTI